LSFEFQVLSFEFILNLAFGIQDFPAQRGSANNAILQHDPLSCLRFLRIDFQPLKTILL
jgi:hypothetical protein